MNEKAFEESVLYEKQAEDTVTGPLERQVQPLLKLLAQAEGTEMAERTREGIIRILDNLAPNLNPELRRQLLGGQKLGAQQAGGKPTKKIEDDEELGDLDLDKETRNRARAAALTARLGDTQTTFTLTNRIVSGARQAVRWAVNRAINYGSTDVAEQKQTGRVWDAERDACLHCLAYSGQIATASGRFPAGLTYDDKPLRYIAKTGPKMPPLHPNCRCRTWPYDGPGPVRAANVPGGDEATALAREARRSVARGWSAFASKPARLRAADRLLTAGAALPKTVRRRSYADVLKQAFSQRHKPITKLNA